MLSQGPTSPDSVKMHRDRARDDALHMWAPEREELGQLHLISSVLLGREPCVFDVRSVTLNKLIELLTTEPPRLNVNADLHMAYEKLVLVFFTTFQSFTSTVVVFEKLHQRISFPPGCKLSDVEQDRFGAASSCVGVCGCLRVLLWLCVGLCACVLVGVWIGTCMCR
jgi:RasGEF N-terminal motif